MAELHPKSQTSTCPVSGDSSVRSVERAIDVLFSSTGRSRFSTSCAAAAHGIVPTHSQRLLRTLEARGLIYSFGKPLRFQLGARIGLLASTWTPSLSLVTLAAAALEQLWRSTQETVALMVTGSASDRMCVFERKSSQALSFSRGVGYTEPLHNGASGKVILAHLTPDQRRHSLSQLSRRARDQIARDMQTVLEDGVLVTHAEVMAGTVAVASPVLTKSGQPVAAVCVFGTELRLRGAKLRSCRSQTAPWQKVTCKQHIALYEGFHPSGCGTFCEAARTKAQLEVLAFDKNNKGGVALFVKQYKEEGVSVQERLLRRGVMAYYYTEFGPLNQIVDMWAYESFEDRLRRRAELVASEEWRSYAKKMQPLVVNVENKLLMPAPFFRKPFEDFEEERAYRVAP
jgi:DNA-binding IclR family transcriptional regulator